MVSHHVQRLPAFKPLLHCFHFAQLHNRVEVAGHEDVHLRVEGGEEPPDHGEHVDGIGKEGMRHLVDRAEVEAVVGTGKAAKVVHQWVFRSDVVVKSNAPVSVVEGGDCIKVCSDPFKVASTLMFAGSRVPIEGEGKDSLAIATLPGVCRTGGRVLEFWESEEEKKGFKERVFRKGIFTCMMFVGFFLNIDIAEAQIQIHF